MAKGKTNWAHAPREAALRIAPRHPAQYVVIAFGIAIAIATTLLLLPVAHEPGTTTSFRQALFTATSAVCVTGLFVVNTPDHWSTFGEVVILGSMQLGGLGIMTAASILGLLVARRFGLRSRLVAANETKTLSLGDVRRVIAGVLVMTLIIETSLSVILATRFAITYDEPVLRAAYLGIFHAVSAFNNAGFDLFGDSLVRFVGDPWICVPLAAGVLLGGLGFPVLLELRRHLWTPDNWSLHTKITLMASGILVVGGGVLITAMEWANPATLGQLGTIDRLMSGFVHAIMPRSGGFNTLDVSAMNETTWFVTDMLMFIGGGSAGTAGGVKVTTFMLLFFAIVAEARGDDDVEAFGRRIPQSAIRQAISVALLGVGIVVTGTLFVLANSDVDLDRVLFEVISAFATVGLSTGITADLPAFSQYVLVALMFIGRTGTITIASAFALREHRRLYRLPKERPIVG